MKKIVSLLLAVLLALPGAVNVFAEDNVILTGPCFATIIQVIDGESFKVKPHGTKDTALVRLVGVDAKTNNKAIEYANEKLMGQLVALTFDTVIGSPSDRFNVVVMTCKEKVVNKVLLEKGFATVRSGESNAGIFQALSINPAPYYPTSSGYISYYDNTYYGTSGGVININTATASQLSAALAGVDLALANKIVDYRAYNAYFDTVEELKNVDGITTKIYDDNVGKMNVVTNINAATRAELLTLKSILNSEADEIISFRNITLFTAKSELYSKSILPRSTYDLNARFIDIADRSSVSGIYEYETGTALLNINTATRSQLTDKLRGVTAAIAQNIIDYRNNNGYFSTINQFRYVEGVSATIYNDNVSIISVYTNINNATREELLTLIDFTSTDADKIIEYRKNNGFSSVSDLYTKSLISREKYDKNERFLVSSGSRYYNYYNDYYYDDSTQSSIALNINTCTFEQLLSNVYGMTYELADNIIAYRINNAYFNSVGDLKLVQGMTDAIYNQNAYRLSVCTNINTASREELRSLKYISETEIDKIIEYRRNRPFANTAELVQQQLISQATYADNQGFISTVTTNYVD